MTENLSQHPSAEAVIDKHFDEKYIFNEIVPIGDWSGTINKLTLKKPLQMQPCAENNHERKMRSGQRRSGNLSSRHSK